MPVPSTGEAARLIVHAFERRNTGSDEMKMKNQFVYEAWHVPTGSSPAEVHEKRRPPVAVTVSSLVNDDRSRFRAALIKRHDFREESDVDEAGIHRVVSDVADCHCSIPVTACRDGVTPIRNS